MKSLFFKSFDSSTTTKLEISDGSIEALKWLALLLMTVDHINHFLYNTQVPAMFALGRIAMPIFGFVLAYNLARHGAALRHMHHKAMMRLLFFGLLASPFYILLINKWLPLNIMFTLLLAVYLIYLLERDARDDRLLCFFTFLIGGMLVDYAWLAPAYCIASWWFCKQPNTTRGLIWIAITTLLWLANLNYWACAAIPLIFLAMKINIKIPRIPLLFYAYYPLHLAVLLLLLKISA